MKAIEYFNPFMTMKTSFIIILFLFLSSHMLGQDVGPRNSDVSALDKYLDFPVDKSTGTANIAIPIYTLGGNGVNLPISVAYHTGGIRVDEMASSVGLGWSLNAGGAISRVIKDFPDELGYFANYGFEFSPSMNMPFNAVDLEPDLFYFNFNGYSGRFLFDKNRKPHLIPEQDITIHVLNNNLNRISITTPDGTKYLFDGVYSYSALYGTFHDPGYDGMLIPNAYHLTKIITANLDEINFEYQDYGYEAKVNIHGPVEVDEYMMENDVCAPCQTQTALSRVHGKVVRKIVSRSHEIRFNYKATLREDIKPGYGSARALESIEVFNKVADKTEKKFLFKTSYFQSTDNVATNPSTGGTGVVPYTVDPYLQKRLRLDEIQELSPTGEALPPFKFRYNKLNTVAQLPNRLSNAQDHWGYYNGKSQNRCLIGYYENYGNVDCNPDFLADRSVDTDFNMAFMLDEVVFPTGGITQYRYDRHSYGYIPGVRMKEIITRPENSKVSARKLYEYSGISLVGGGPLYVQSFPNANHLGPGNWPGTAGYVRAGLQMLSEPCGDMVVYIAFANIANFEGDLIGRHGFYESVVETQPGNGSIETYFSVDEVDNYMMGSDTYPLIFNKPALMLGKPVREVVKREDGVPVREVRYEYGYYHRKIVEEADAARLYASPCKQIIQYYPIYTGFSFLKKKEDIVYSKKANNDLAEKMVATTYDYGGIQEEYKNHQWAVNPGDYGEPLHHFVTEQAVGPVMDAYRFGRKKYAIDFSSDIEGSATSFDASSEAINELLDRGVTAAVVEEISTVSRDGAETVLGGKLNIYEKRTVDKGMGNTVELVSLKAVANLEPQTPLPYTAGFFSKIEGQNNTYLFNYNENYVIQSTVSEYDKWSNVLEYDEKGENKKAYLYGHQEFLPIIEAENTSYSDLRANVGLALEEMGYTNGLLDLDIFLASLRDLAAPSQKAAWNTFMERVRNKYASQAVLLNFYAYNEYGGASAIADYNTRNTYYEYDVHKRLVNVLDDKSNIRQNYQYHYLDPDRAFFNEVQSRTYQKNDCPNEATGSSVAYTIPAGKYTSPYSQEAANQLAIEDLDINGQAYANEHGECTGGTVLYYNVYMSRTFTKECPSGQIGTEEEYEVHAGEYSSAISQADADSKALNDINTNGQAYVNSSGSCRIVTNLEWANYTSDGNNRVTSIRFYNAQGTTLLQSFGPNNLDEYDTNIIDRGIYKVVVEVQGGYYDQMSETGYVGIRMRLSTSNPFSYIDVCQNHPDFSNTSTYTFEQVDLTNRDLMVFQIVDAVCN